MRLQVVFSLLSAFFSDDWASGPLTRLKTPSVLGGGSDKNAPNKSIAIVGAGSAGLAMLKTLTELPEETRRSLEFTLFEEREDVGGIWYVKNLMQSLLLLVMPRY